MGQGRRLGLRDTYLNKRLHPSILSRMTGPMKYLAKWIVTRADPLDQSVNNLIYPVLLVDGRPYWAFRRFGTWDEAHRDDLGLILSRAHLERLCKTGGYMIVYIHLGKKRHKGAALFTEGEKAALDRLARYFQDKKILVTTTARLLSYHLVWRGLSFSVGGRDNRPTILLTGIRDEVDGDRVAEPADLAGITFFTSHASGTVIKTGETHVVHTVFEKDKKGTGFIGVPWEGIDA